MSTSLDISACAEAARVCACFNFRKASRVVTQYFDDALQPTGLRSTQLVVLLGIAVKESSSIAALARELVMDASTLARNLQPLEKQGLIKLDAGVDGRQKNVSLTKKGTKKLAEAIPYWEQAQAGFVQQLGADQWEGLIKSLNEVVNATR